MVNYKIFIDQREKDYILAALKENGGNIAHTSKATGMSRQNLYLRIKYHKIKLRGGVKHGKRK